MSRLVDATITCPKCGTKYPVKLFRTLWGENDALRDRVMSDEVNVCCCPNCKFSFKAPFPFMYIDVEVGFAVWWEPEHDPGIDLDTAGYAKMFGSTSYYATAPRIKDWQEFKETIQKYYRGELVGGKIERVDLSELKRTKPKQKTSGCMLTLLLFLIVGSCLSFL